MSISALLVFVVLGLSAHAQTIELRTREVIATSIAGNNEIIDFQIEARVQPNTPTFGISSLNFSIFMDCEPESYGVLQRGSLVSPFRFISSTDSTANGFVNATVGTHTNNVLLHEIVNVRASTGGQFLLQFTDEDANGVPDTSSDGLTATLTPATGVFFGSSANWIPLYRFRYTTSVPRCREPVSINIVPSSAAVFSTMSRVAGVWQPDSLPAQVSALSTRWNSCLSPPYAPRADYNRDLFFTTTDIFAYLNDWFASCIGPATACNNRSADFNCDGLLTPQDIFDFLNAWFLQT